MKTITSAFQFVFLVFMLVVLTTLPTGCGSYSTGDAADVNPESIFGEYRIEVDANKSDVILHSQFRFASSDGTTLRLQNPASVRATGGSLGQSGTPMREENMLGTSYSIALPNRSLPSEFSIIYTRTDGRVFTQSIPVHAPPSLKIPANDPTITYGKNLIVEFSLDNTTDFRSAVCKIENESEGVSVFAYTRNAHCTFDAEDLARLPTGTAFITVQATWVSQSVTGHERFGGEKRVEATSQKQQFRISAGT
jgi:hypothetical protein